MKLNFDALKSKLKIKNNRDKEIFVNRKKSRKHGSYSAVVTLILAAILIVINLIMAELPTKYTQIDVSSEKLYTIGSQTEEVVNNLESEVDIYYICQSGQEDDTLKKMLERYDDLSDKITVEEKDPVLYPNFTSQYTSDEVVDNSLIVVSGEKSKVISFDTIYESEMNYSTYAYDTTGFDGEGQLTSAISYVTSDNLPILYTLEGHSEVELSTAMISSIEKENIEIKSLNLVTEESVPEDTDILMINGPQKDLSEEESQKIITYLENGGKAFIISNYTTEDMPNFNSILEDYGVQTEDGVIIEGDSNNCIPQAPYYLVPDIQNTDITSSLVSNNHYVLIPLAQGIVETEDHRDTLNIENLLTTSDSAYAKSDVENMTTYSKEDGDINGPFNIAVSVTESIDDDNETQLVYLTSSNILDDTVDAQVSGGNTEFIMNCISAMSDHEVTVSIPSKSTEISYLTYTAASANMWSIIVIGIIPIAILVTGIVIWLKRRKK